MSEPTAIPEEFSPEQARPHIPGLKIWHKIALTFCLLLILVLTVFWLITRNQLTEILQRQSDSLGSSLVSQTAASITELVLANDLLSLNVVLNQLTRNDIIANVAVFNIDNEVIASSSTAGAETSGLINSAYTAQIALQDSIAGTVRLTLDLSSLNADINQTSRYFWLTLLAGLVFALVTAMTLGQHIIRPIETLIAQLGSPLETETVIDPARSDELALLQASCQELIAAARYPGSSQVLRKKPGDSPDLENGVRVQASILIINVVNMDTAIELLHPSTLSRLLNECHLYIQQAGNLYGGDIHRFTGESATLAFDSRQLDEHGLNAVCCAQLFLRLMKMVNQRHLQKSSPTLEFRLGIHSGDIFLAHTRQGSGTVEISMGKTIDTGFCICDMAGPGQIMISESTLFQAGGDSKLTYTGSKEMSPEADNTSFMAYILSEDMGGYSELLDHQTLHILADTN